MLIAGHGVILYYVSSHMALSTVDIAGVIALVVVKHLGKGAQRPETKRRYHRLATETRNEKAQDFRTHLAGRRDPDLR